MYETNTSFFKVPARRGRPRVGAFLAALCYHTAAELPAELKGKSPEEVAAYYQGLLKTQKSTYDAALEALGTDGGSGTPPPAKPAEPPKVTFSDFMADPSKHVKDQINATAVSREEFNAVTKAAQESFIYLAKQRAMEKIRGQEDKLGTEFLWDRFGSDIEKIVNAAEPFHRTNPGTWEAAYYYVAGSNRGTLTKEAVTKATMPAEPAVPGGNNPPAPTVLTPEQKQVAESLGLTEDSYRAGADRMKANKFPLTMDNRVRR